MRNAILFVIVVAYAGMYIYATKSVFGVPSGVLSMAIRVLSWASIAALLSRELRNAKVARSRVVLYAASAVVSVLFILLMESAMLALSWKIK